MRKTCLRQASTTISLFVPSPSPSRYSEIGRLDADTPRWCHGHRRAGLRHPLRQEQQRHAHIMRVLQHTDVRRFHNRPISRRGQPSNWQEWRRAPDAYPVPEGSVGSGRLAKGEGSPGVGVPSACVLGGSADRPVPVRSDWAIVRDTFCDAVSRLARQKSGAWRLGRDWPIAICYCWWTGFPRIAPSPHRP